jgi:hypothetical protein
MLKRPNAELTGWADAARHRANEQKSTRAETFENSLGSAQSARYAVRVQFCNWMDPAFDNGDKIRYNGFIVINLSDHYSQKGGMYVATLNHLSRLQGIAACYCLYTPPLEDA